MELKKGTSSSYIAHYQATLVKNGSTWIGVRSLPSKIVEIWWPLCDLYENISICLFFTKIFQLLIHHPFPCLLLYNNALFVCKLTGLLHFQPDLTAAVSLHWCCFVNTMLKLHTFEAVVTDEKWLTRPNSFQACVKLLMSFWSASFEWQVSAALSANSTSLIRTQWTLVWSYCRSKRFFLCECKLHPQWNIVTDHTGEELKLCGGGWAHSTV